MLVGRATSSAYCRFALDRRSDVSRRSFQGDSCRFQSCLFKGAVLRPDESVCGLTSESFRPVLCYVFTALLSAFERFDGLVFSDRFRITG